MQQGGGWKQTKESGEWENGNSVYQEETGKARKQNPVASRMRLPEAGYLYSDSLPYIKIRVYIGFSLLLTQRPDTPHQLWGINCQLKYILQQAGEWKVMMISLLLTLAVAAGQGSVLGCPTALVTRFIFQMALQLITYLQVTTLSFSVLYLKENLIYWSIFIMHKRGQYINIHTDTWVGTCVSKQIFP